jgi:hypothetical protein
LEEKYYDNLGYFCIKKLPKLNNHPIGENSPNLVTLVAGKDVSSGDAHRILDQIDRCVETYNKERAQQAELHNNFTTLYMLKKFLQTRSPIIM